MLQQTPLRRAHWQITPHSSLLTPYVVLGFFTLLSIIMTWPLVTLLDRGIDMHGDAVLQLTTMTWVSHAFTANPLHLFDAPFFYPYYHTLALSDHLIGQTLLTYPVIALSGNPALAMNLYKLFTFIMTGYGTYLLVRDTVGSRSAALLSGVAFTFTNFRFLELSHLHILATEWFPLTIWALRRGLFRNSPRWMGLSALFFLLMALCSVYYTYFLAIAVAAYLAWWALVWWRGGGKPALGRNLLSSRPARLLFTWTPAAIITLLVYLPYAQLNAELGASRPISEVQNWAATWQYYVQVLPTNVFWAGLFPAMSTVRGERILFPGLILLLLAVAGLLYRTKREDRERAMNHLPSTNTDLTNSKPKTQNPKFAIYERWYWIALGVGAFILTFGLSYALPNGQQIPLPYTLMYNRIPGFQGLRVPIRFIVLVDLALAVFAGWGVLTIRSAITRLITRLTNTHDHRLSSLVLRPSSIHRLLPAALWLLALLAILTESAQSLDFSNNRPMRVPQSELYGWYAWLAQHGSGPVIEFPFKANSDEIWYAYFDTYYWQPIIDGWSGFTPPGITYLSRALSHFPDDASISLLQALEVQHIIIHLQDYPAANREAIRTKLSHLSALSLAYSAQDHYIYTLTANPWLRQLGSGTAAKSSPQQFWFSGEIDGKRNVKHPEMEVLAYFARYRLGWTGIHGDVPIGYKPLPPLPPGQQPDYIIQPADQPPPQNYIPSERNAYAIIYRRP